MRVTADPCIAAMAMGMRRGVSWRFLPRAKAPGPPRCLLGEYVSFHRGRLLWHENRKQK